MIATFAWIRARLNLLAARRRFPRSVIHVGATLSDDSGMDEASVLFAEAALLDSRLGAFSYVQARTVVTAADIGPFCSIAANVCIGLAAHPTHMVSTSPVFYDPAQPLPKFLVRERRLTSTLPRTSIGADVWVGQNALVRAGVRVGVGAVIGAGAVVTRDVAPYSIVGGSPARLIRRRFADDLCDRLLESRWWELPLGELERLAPDFSDPEKLLKALRERPSNSSHT